MSSKRDTSRKSHSSAPRKKSPRGRQTASIFVIVALAVIFLYQASWQVAASRRPDFMRFMRRYNSRPVALARRGTILDRNGSIFAIDDEDARTRRYPLGAAAAHVVGYFSPRYGIAGIERDFDERLFSGAPTTNTLELAKSLMIRPEGQDVKLTLDARLQRRAYELLENRAGAVVALIPTSGEVLALVSSPSFDPANPAEAFSAPPTRAPLLNRATQGRYPPGSTFKILMAAIAVETRQTPTFDCPAAGFVPAPHTPPIRDSEYYSFRRENRTWRGFGRIGLREAFAHSSNVYFAQLGQRLDPALFDFAADIFSLKLPPFAEIIPAERSQLAIGQGKLAVSPMQVASWTATIANRGTFVPPTFSEASTNRFRVFSAATAENVASLMREGVRRGTGKGIDLDGYEVCGKTGTAQTSAGGENTASDHSWFTCFAPQSSPEIVITVIVEKGGYGSKSALPIARELLQEARSLGYVSGAARR